jgi:hypothetical protein
MESAAADAIRGKRPNRTRLPRRAERTTIRPSSDVHAIAPAPSALGFAPVAGVC